MNDRSSKARIALRNRYLIDELLNNPRFTFSNATLEMTNFPPRPMIKKDKNALEFVHQIRPRLEVVHDV